MTDLRFTDDRTHNYNVLNQLIKSACPDAVRAYWIEGYVDDDFEGYSDTKLRIANVLALLCRTSPVPRFVAKAVVKANKKRASKS